MGSSVEVDETGRTFYQCLSRDLDDDWEEVEFGSYELYMQADELGQFDFKYLDFDGKTSRTSELFEKGVDILKSCSFQLSSKR